MDRVGGRDVFGREEIASEKAMRWIGLVGAAVMLGLHVGALIWRVHRGSERVGWERLTFYVSPSVFRDVVGTASTELCRHGLSQTYLAVLAAVPFIGPLRRRAPSTLSTHFSTLLLVIILSDLFIFRTALIDHSVHRTERAIEITSFAVLVSWAFAYVSMPYRNDLDGVLTGYKAGDGQGAGETEVLADGTQYVVNRNPTEPTCEFRLVEHDPPGMGDVDTSATIKPCYPAVSTTI
jgi:hypothetical protein